MCAMYLHEISACDYSGTDITWHELLMCVHYNIGLVLYSFH